MWEFIDKLVYINLDHREDRRQIMQKLFDEGQIPTEKIHRFSAIKHDVGICGAAMSHIGVLKLAKQNEWKSILVLEDDVNWVNFEENYKKLEDLVSKPFDVCMLGGLYVETTPPKVHFALFTNSHIIRSHYYDVLLENYETALKIKLDKKVPSFPIKSPSEKKRLYNQLVDADNFHNIDVFWIREQLRGNWVGIIPSMTSQVPSYSDIYHKDVDNQSLVKALCESINSDTINSVKFFLGIYNGIYLE